MKKLSATQKTINELKKYLESDEAVIGDKLATEKEVCEKLSVGRGTVREAFRDLEAEGYISIEPGKGAFIIRKTQNDTDALVNWFTKNRGTIQDYVEFRNIIEPAAARMAAARASDGDILELKEVHETFITTAAVMDDERLAYLDEEFHSKIMKMTGNEVMQLINHNVNKRIMNFRFQTFKIRHNVDNAIEAHGKILRAITDRDPDVAEMYMKRHIELIDEDMERIIVM
ncbi:FadR/GntR family transcriptional regulator [Oribacterium sp. WCC10]|uniref:FadR/GntR family transcriptional regulator n=1 Tax=Oribacterium sp. WCC10 TaxID=1855343 RepID=UPI0008E02FF9|nr:FCD domain-containing protein [Oribacterium sp. WCC10]SFG53767.1 GntR family transcriptional regulator, transcriptional repressor for pyruvate dehydrogenase complex [Oribacterium sp. WCC10]